MSVWQSGFGQHHLISIFFNLLKLVCKDAPCNKLCGSTNFIFFGLTNQKLWIFEVFRRSLDRMGMSWSQWGRIDHMCKNLGVGGRKKGAGEVQQRGTVQEWAATMASSCRRPTTPRPMVTDCWSSSISATSSCLSIRTQHFLFLLFFF